MEIVTSIQRMRELSTRWRQTAGTTIGFVPTMGALHNGHARLIKESRSRAKVTVVSSFVNPLQFTESQDFQTYPRTPEADHAVAEQLGVEAFFEPKAGEMFPPGFLTTVSVSYLSNALEGESRPGHFRGVCTVVTKLFNIVQPHIAVFGQKDAQQFVIIRHMVRDMNLGIQILGVPTVRDKNGLALSSRNQLLTEEQKGEALCLKRALQRVHFLVRKQNITHSGELLQAVRSAINSSGPQTQLDYARIVSRTTLDDLDNIEFGNTLVLVAARVGAVRLIDSTRL